MAPTCQDGMGVGFGVIEIQVQILMALYFSCVHEQMT